MKDQLFTTNLTGYRRKGTRFTSLKQIFTDNVTAKSICEPLLSCPIDSNSLETKNALEDKGFDVVGIKTEKEGDVVGYVLANEIGENDLYTYVHDIKGADLISDSTPIAKIIEVISKNDYSFVLYGNKISGIITIADINKPPVRIYIFGMVSLLEMHLNFWINYHYPDGVSWVEGLKENRIGDAKAIYEKRKRNKQDLNLLDCLQLCDKRDLLKNCDEFRTKFAFSKKKFHIFLKRTEDIRNELAHSQNSITSPISLDKFVSTIKQVEHFLIASDNIIEDMAKAGKDSQNF